MSPTPVIQANGTSFTIAARLVRVLDQLDATEGGPPDVEMLATLKHLIEDFSRKVRL